MTRQAGRTRPATDASPRPPVPTSPNPEDRAAIASLVGLAELDGAVLRPPEARRPPDHGERADRHGLGARLPPALLEEYDRALRAGREPAVVPLVDRACSGCHVRLHAKLEHQIRARLGAASCPRCLRVVYDPTWLSP
jgi:hypothetical protein